MDKEKQREQARLRVQRYRDKQKALHSDSVTSPSVTGLDGKRVSLLSMVRYGIGGITFKEIKNAIK